jgi:hypothetical protein
VNKSRGNLSVVTLEQMLEAQQSEEVAIHSFSGDGQSPSDWDSKRLKTMWGDAR